MHGNSGLARLAATLTIAGFASTAKAQFPYPDLTVPLPYDATRVMSVNAIFEVRPEQYALYDELAKPQCAAGRRLIALRYNNQMDSPFAGGNAKESWVDLHVSQGSDEGWRNQGIMIPEAYASFYEPTRMLGGWKKQMITDTTWQATADGWLIENVNKGTTLTQLRYHRGEYSGGLPDYLGRYLQDPPQVDIDPNYIIQPADLPPVTYPWPLGIEVHKTKWTYLGKLTKYHETGTVEIVWNKPPTPFPNMDNRWQDLLPPSGTVVPGYFYQTDRADDVKLQTWEHHPIGPGDCPILAAPTADAGSGSEAGTGTGAAGGTGGGIAGGGAPSVPGCSYGSTGSDRGIAGASGLGALGALGALVAATRRASRRTRIARA